MKNIILSLLLLPALALCTVLGGITIQTLWAWFAIPVFALPALSIAHAIGINLLVTYITWQDMSRLATKNSDASTWQKIYGPVLTAYIQVAVFLGMGWLVHQFV